MNAKRKRIVLVCCAVMVVALGVIIVRLAGQRSRGEIYEDLQQTVSSSQPSSSVSQSVQSAADPEPEPEPEPETSPIDFEALWEINPDVYAWVEIPDTEVNYPVLQHPTETDYYLFHTIENASGRPGAIYSQIVSPKDFSAFNTILYGHDMPDFSMFGSLESYRDEAYLAEHPNILIHTPDNGTLTYKIFAAVIYSDKLIPYYFDDDDVDDRQRFLDSLSTEVRNMNNHILEDVEVTPDDHILTLSTCVGLQSEYRYLVIGVLQEDE